MALTQEQTDRIRENIDEKGILNGLDRSSDIQDPQFQALLNELNKAWSNLNNYIGDHSDPEF